MKPHVLVQVLNPESGLRVPPPPPGVGSEVVVGVAVVGAAAGVSRPIPSLSEEGGITADVTDTSKQYGPQACAACSS